MFEVQEEGVFSGGQKYLGDLLMGVVVFFEGQILKEDLLMEWKLAVGVFFGGQILKGVLLGLRLEEVGAFVGNQKLKGGL